MKINYQWLPRSTQSHVLCKYFEMSSSAESTFHDSIFLRRGGKLLRRESNISFSFSCKAKYTRPAAFPFTFFQLNDFLVLSLSPSSLFLSFTDYANRGPKKFGDKCESTTECGFPDSICDSKKRSCQCVIHLPVTNHIDKCGRGKQ